MPLQIIDRPVVGVARWIEAYVSDAKLRELTTLIVISRRILRPEIQAGASLKGCSHFADASKGKASQRVSDYAESIIAIKLSTSSGTSSARRAAAP
jgi:hypothetical protein